MSKSICINRIRIRPSQRKVSGTRCWIADVPADMAGGKRSRRFFDSVKEAKTFANTYSQRLFAGLGPSNDNASQRLTFEQLTSEWLAKQEVCVTLGKKKQSSLNTDLNRLKKVLPRLGSEFLDGFDTDLLEWYQVERLSDRVAPDTVNSDMRLIRKIINWGKRSNKGCSMPEIEGIPGNDKKPYIPTRDEMAVVLANACERSRIVIRFILETGCRAGEAYHLKWQHFNFDKLQVSICAEENWTPKTKHSVRTIPIGSALSEEIAKLPRVSCYVFSGRAPDRPLTSVRKALATAVKRAGLTHMGEPVHLTVHDLRKIYASWQAMAGVPERVLQDLLGHAPGTSVTNKHYSFTNDEAKRKAVLSICDGDNDNE